VLNQAKAIIQEQQKHQTNKRCKKLVIENWKTFNQVAVDGFDISFNLMWHKVKSTCSRV